MADQTPPGPTASGRIAGVIAVIALVLGGYYAVVARTPPAGEAPAAGIAPAASSDAGKPAEPAAAASTEVASKAAPEAGAKQGDAAKDADGADQAQKNQAAEGAAPNQEAAKEAAAGNAAPAKETAADAAKPAPDSGAKPADAGNAAVAAPSFDVVRVEPTGEAVVAGLAEPKASVELLDGPAPIAKGEANDRGEWALVVEKPLAPGTHDLSIRTTSKDGKTQTLSEQRVAIEVPEPNKGEALVVLNQPDAPSRVLQMPADAKAASETQTAATAAADASAAQKPAGEPNAAADASAPAKDDAPAESKMAAAAPEAAVNAAAPAASAADSGEAAANAAGASSETPSAEQKLASADAKSAPATAADQGATAPAASAGGTEAAAANGAEPAKEAAAGNANTAAPAAAATGAASAPAASDASTAAAPAPAVKQEASAEPAKAVPSQPVTVDAVEFENGTIYIAGSAALGGVIRVYVDGVAVGDVQAGEGGRWLLETKHDMQPGKHTVRADQIEKDSGAVVQRAEVPFEQQVDVAVLAPVTTGGGGTAGASGAGDIPGPQNVIIRRGDNLWTISRRLYGRGVRYSTIYEANTDQIRNPHWIYPGQIFVLPAGDARWTN